MDWSKWNRWARQTHRWMSMLFMVAVIINFVALAFGKLSFRVYLLPLPPLGLLMITAVYLFVLPYAAKWRGTRRAEG